MATERMTLEDQARIVAGRLAALGVERYPVPANNGSRRTASKKALLAELDELGRERAAANESNTPAR